MAYLRFFIYYRESILSILLLTVISCFCACEAKTNALPPGDPPYEVKEAVRPGIYQVSQYLPMLKGKRVGAVVNHTSMIDHIHLIDTLLALDVDLQLIFAPEHGFKGTAYNGEEISDGLYQGKIKIRSLYGKTRKPSMDDMDQVDVILFDIQDVGARFYTYISTLHYVMEAAAESNVPVIILDRPNPNAHYVDGPIMKDEYRSFVGMHPVPIVYGMTMGEYGHMINGEGWLGNDLSCYLTVIEVANYSHKIPYSLPISPSPNLPNYRSILLYPSLCLLEGTVMNEGRGTNRQFQIYGHPLLPKESFSYTPVSMTSSKYPKHEGKLCGGRDLTSRSPEDIYAERKINLSYLIDSYQNVGDIDEETPFFLTNGWINKLAGTSDLARQIKAGLTGDEIRKTWAGDLRTFMSIREPYLLYPD